MKVSAISSAILLAGSSVSAFYIIDPYTGGKNSNWATGSKGTVTWQVTNLVNPKNCSSLTLELMNGPSENAVRIQDLAKSIANDATTTLVTVPSVKTGNDYFVRLTCESKDRPQFYSSRFTITNTNGGNDGGSTKTVNPVNPTPNPNPNPSGGNGNTAPANDGISVFVPTVVIGAIFAGIVMLL